VSLRIVTEIPTTVIPGLDTSVRGQGEILHVQTEVSGECGEIVTEVYSVIGQVLRTVRSDYRRSLGQPDVQHFLTRALRSQHATVVQLLGGCEGDVATEIPPRPARFASERAPLGALKERRARHDGLVPRQAASK
jgi:hypothetical protein